MISVKRSVALAHAVAGAIAGNVLDEDIVNRAIRRLGRNDKAHRPFRVVWQGVVIMLEIITFQRAVYQVSVLDIRYSDNNGVDSRKRIFLQRSAVQVERHVRGQAKRPESAHAIGARQHHDLSESGGRLVVEKLLKALRRFDRGLLDLVGVVAWIVHNMKSAP